MAAGADDDRSGEGLTIDQLAAVSDTTSRRIRSFQTLGLLPRPELRGRTGLYGRAHHERLTAILRLQALGFSLESLGVLFEAHAANRSLADVLGVTDQDGRRAAPEGGDEAELYGFAELQRTAAVLPAPRHRPLLSVVPTTVWDESRAS